jgi:sugar phosphate isomerase/epimerase
MTEFSYQLYSSRNFPPLADTMKMVSALGYTQVEGYGGLYTEPEQVAELRKSLDQTKLAMPSGHFGLDQLESDPAGVLAIAGSLGIKMIFCPYLAADQRPADAEGYVALGQRLQEAGKPFGDAGLGFGWHNHDFEFVALADGSTPMERIFQGGPDLTWEADIAWIVRGGAEPLGWIERENHRITAVHLKDIAPPGESEDEDGWADVGSGTMDWPGLMAALRATPVARLLVMEHDNPNDHKRFARRSIAAARTFCGNSIK